MNKANVFLLVVVSSLLTYISTATQPAATAGVAQEKWEYGVSMSLTTGDYWSFTFDTFNGSKDLWPDAQVTWSPKQNFVVKYGTDPSDYIVSESDKLQYCALVGDLWTELGNNGWHPYHVVPDNTIRPIQAIQPGTANDRVYWRRRVQ